MAVSYIKTYKINSREYGIEDYKDGKPDDDHFFAHNYKSGQRQRFNLWSGGCGFGQAKTLEEAEKKMAYYIKKEIEENIEKHQSALEFWRDTKTIFSNYGIGKFGI